MKIGVISDTHSIDVPQEVLKALKDADLIIHAGDFCTLDDVKKFSRIKELKAVYGNMDEPAVRRKFSAREIIETEGCKIGLCHGQGAAKDTLAFVQKEFEKDNVDAVVFGHTHTPLNQEIRGILYFNPGSPNDTIYAPYCSYGIIEIENKKIKGKIIKLK